MYPAEILPKQEYLQKIDISLLLHSYSNLFVARRIDGSKKELVCSFDGNIILKDAALEQIGVANFSVNLLGGDFDAQTHIAYRPIEEALIQGWQGENIDVNIMIGKYEILAPCFAVYYNLNDFINFPLNQEMTFFSDKDYCAFILKAKENRKEAPYLEEFRQGKEMSFPVDKKANHAPTRCNYWHVTLDTYPYEYPTQSITTTDKSKPHKRILRHLRHDYLTQHGLTDIENYDTIYYRLYYKGWYNTLVQKLYKLIGFLK